MNRNRVIAVVIQGTPAKNETFFIVSQSKTIIKLPINFLTTYRLYFKYQVPGYYIY